MFWNGNDEHFPEQMPNLVSVSFSEDTFRGHMNLAEQVKIRGVRWGELPFNLNYLKS